MTIKYRPHRGGLLASMQELVELEDLQALRKHVGDDHATIHPHYDEPDERIGWEKTCIVKDARGFPLGFTDRLK